MSQTVFLDKTLQAIAYVAAQSLFSATYAERKGLLQSLDMRVKLITFFYFSAVISLVSTPAVLLLLCALSLLLAMFSRVTLFFFIKRVLPFVLFSAVIVLPALLNIITPGENIWVIVRLDQSHSWGPYSIPKEIAVTRQGLWGGIMLVSRVTASVSFTVLFTLTAKWETIFAGLRSLFVPRIFVMTFGMTYRYIFVFLRMIQDMYRGRKSRTIHPLSAAAERSWVASRIGVTFKKSMEMAEDIYKAMLSRGFHGEFRPLIRFRTTMVDYFWLVTVLCFSGILIILERGVIR